VVLFKKPLRRFQRFRLTARLAYWHDKWLYIEHRLVRDHETIAAALSKSMIFGKDGLIAPVAAISALGYSVPQPPMPAMIEKFREGEMLMREQQK
jgi:hypothetical protein